MTTLTLRQATEKDWPALVKMGLDIRHLKSEGVYAVLCYEGKALVGAATGTVDLAPRLPGDKTPHTGRLWWVRSLLPGRVDILLACIEWHIDNGIKTGCERAEVPAIPYDMARQCTGVMETGPLVGAVKAKLTIGSVTEGRNTLTGQPAHERILVENLPLVKAEFDTWLKALGVTRVWQ
jgi:hypothetical protein